jgi:hypothetical protein
MERESVMESMSLSMVSKGPLHTFQEDSEAVSL